VAKRAVTLYFDDRSIRLMVSAGKTIRAWALAPLEPGVIEGGLVLDEETVIATVKKLLADKKVRSKKVIVGMSGLRSLTLAADLPQLPDNLLAEALMRECARAFPVPLDELYVSWMTLPSPRNRTRAFAAALPRNTTDSLLGALKRAGLTPVFMDIKPLALARLANQADAVIVDVQSREYDIVIIGNGLPQPVRTIPLPAEGLSWPERVSMIRDDLVRTMDFYDTNNPDRTIAADMPVHVSGELADEPEARKALSAELGRPVLPLLVPFRYRQECPRNSFAVNAGLSLKTASRRGKALSPVAKLDALPPAYQPQSFSISRVMALTTTAVVFSLTIPLVALVQVNSADIAESRARLGTMLTDMEQRKVERRELTKSLVQTEASWNVFATALLTLDMRQQAFNAALRVATELVPGNVSLSDINHDGSTVVLEVTSLAETEVLDYARSLEKSDEFSEVRVVKMTRAECGMMHFTLILGVAE